MIDMHIHTIYSDGDKSVEDVLKMCEERKLEYISITDHNTLKQYKDAAFGKNLFSGKVVRGVEMSADFHKKKIEILAYNVKDSKMIEEWSQKFFSKEMLRHCQKEEKIKLLNACRQKGLKYDESKIEQDISATDYVAMYIYNELMRHEENYDILGEYAESLDMFIRKGLMNPDSEFYIGSVDVPKPEYEDVIDVIHSAGGLAFLAHPFEYRFDDTMGFIDGLRSGAELDGIECFHPSADDNQMKILEDYANKYNLYISGGSDYHGDKKPSISIGVGKGNLCISKEYVEKWINI